jgi:hypothetical protein
MKMWEIREGSSRKDDYRDNYRGSYRFGRRGSMGMREDEDAFHEGYECGFEDGYAKAMKDTFYSHEEKDSYGERRMSR